MNKVKLLVSIFALLLPTLVHGGEYVIGEGDGLDIAVWGNKELNVSVKVRPDGMITMPGLGDVKSSGIPPRELQKRIEERLKELVMNPIVTVTVREITNSKVYVFGGGVESRVYDLNRRLTLLQLLCMIGNTSAGDGEGGGAGTGVTNKVADYRRAYLIRDGKKIKEDFYKLFITGDTGEDMVVESNDAIFIPQMVDKKVYVLGAVTSPRSIDYREGMTVMEAILESGGFTKFAKQNDTTILRKEGGKDVSIPIKARDLIKEGDLSQNVRLKPADYIIVEEAIF